MKNYTRNKDDPEKQARAERIKNSTYDVNENGKKTITLTFPQLCAYFGIKYNAMYNRVVFGGADVADALKACRNDPRTWGVTYSYNAIARGVWDDKKTKKRKY